MRGREWKVLLAGVAAVVASVALAPSAVADAGPMIDPASLYAGGLPCGSASAPPTSGQLAAQLEAYGTDAATNPSMMTTYTFLIAPVDDPAAATTVVDDAFDGSLGRATVPDAALSSGHIYAWRVQATDDNGTSPWSAACEFTDDTVAPPAPTVTSNYPLAAGAARNTPATFTFDTGGSPDVAAYQFDWQSDLPIPGCSYDGPLGGLRCPDFLTGPGIVAAAGSPTTVTLRVPHWGINTLSVRSLDAAGNVSSTISYQFYAADTGPLLTLAGRAPQCGDTLSISLRPSPEVGPVRAYYWSAGGRANARRVAAAADGTAAITVPLSAARQGVFASSVSRNGFHSTSGELSGFGLHPTPFVTGDVYSPYGVGVSGTFTFFPPGGDVVAYRYRFGSGPTAVVAAADDGSASVSFTPTTAGRQSLQVRAVGATPADSSCRADYSFVVARG